MPLKVCQLLCSLWYKHCSRSLKSASTAPMHGESLSKHNRGNVRDFFFNYFFLLFLRTFYQDIKELNGVEAKLQILEDTAIKVAHTILIQFPHAHTL